MNLHASGADSGERNDSWRLVADVVVGLMFSWLIPTFISGSCTEVHIPCVVWRSAGVNRNFNLWGVNLSLWGVERGAWFTSRYICDAEAVAKYFLRSAHAVNPRSWRN